MNRSPDDPRPTPGTYGGLFLVALATLMYELLLTRIFSVTMWYHFAFLVISITMFGMSVGAIVVYLLPKLFTRPRAHDHLTLSAVAFALTLLASFLLHLRIPLKMEISILELRTLALIYVVISIPFIFSGICVCLALTKFPERVGRLYAADLVGAALGCLLLIVTLNRATAPTTVTIVALLAALGAICFAAAAGVRPRRFAQASAALIILAIGAQVMTARAGNPLFRLIWVKGERGKPALFEKWNSFSLIRVLGDPDKLEVPTGWGFSSVCDSLRPVRQLQLLIDDYAGTYLTKFDGSLDDIDYLRCDITNLVHHVRTGADVAIIGPGAGRDVLSSLLFEQKSVTAIEINGAILEAVNGEFGDFTGHLDRLPNVRFVNDEARSYIARQDDRFGIIQISLIDTFAATSAGAFVLTENSLYTTEAWKVFLDHLTDDGILTVSRWYFRQRPGSVYRMAALAAAALERMGVVRPRGHILIARQMLEGEGDGVPSDVGIGTILVSPSPFSDADLDAYRRTLSDYRFEPVLDPSDAVDATFERLVSGEDISELLAQYPIDISAPTDDRPFFFNMLRFSDVFRRDLWLQGYMSFNMIAVSILGALLLIVIVLTSLCIVLPLVLTTDKSILRGASPLLAYFLAIGLGFMLIEISQMQRLVVFLGHPTYGLSVVLFTLLLSSGAGSFLTQSIGRADTPRVAAPLFGALIAVALLFGLFTAPAAHALETFSTPARIAAAFAMLFPLGFVMGMAFPLGMRLAASRTAALTPWLWGINGAASVCASVVAVVAAMSWGISVTYWIGFACYAVAVIAYFISIRSGPAPATQDGTGGGP